MALAGLSPFTLALAAAAPPPAVRTATELKAQLLATQERIVSLAVEYRSDVYDDPTVPPGAYLYRRVVLKRPHFLHHLSAHGHRALAWQDDCFQQRAILAGPHLDNEFPLNRTFFSQAVRLADGLPGSLPAEFFFVATGVWPLVDVAPPRPNGRPYVLREVALSEFHTHVRPQLEACDGRWCHVLEAPGSDRLWLDADRGALLARETHSPINGALVQRIELSEQQEVAPGIWLPFRMRNMQWDYLAPTAASRQRIVRDAMHTVLSLSVNDVQDSEFEFHAPAGAVRIGHGARTQVVPGGLDHLDSVHAWLTRHVERRQPHGAWRRTSEYALALAPSLGLIALAEGLRRRRNGSVRQTASTQRRLGRQRPD